MEFLNQFWGSEAGKRFVLFKKGGAKKGGQNRFFYSSEEAARFASEMNAQGYDVWFSLALFGDGDGRTQPNALSASSFWLDIDVGEDKGYATPALAVQAIIDFCERLKLPRPTLVNSGTGLHVHWLMDTRVDKERWNKTAQALKKACVKLSLKAGPERTADIASVLRIPGTKHLKNPLEPKDVTLLCSEPPSSLVAFETALMPYVTVSEATRANKVFEINLPKVPGDANLIAEKCAVVRSMRDTGGVVPEPIWYGVVQLLTHCTDGEKYAHEWSRNDPRYTEQGTQDRYDRSSAFGPTLCARFAEYDPESCASCPFNGKVATPLQLGTALTPVKITRDQTLSQPVYSAEHSDSDSAGVEEWTPKYITPPNYLVGEQGVYFVDEEKRTPVLDHPLWLEQLVDSIHEGHMHAGFAWVTRTGKLRRRTIPMSSLTDLRETAKWLASSGITGFAPRNIETVKNYMWACVNAFQIEHDALTVYERFGWYKDGFILGSSLIQADAVIPVQLAERVPKRMTKALVEKGELEAWAKATETLRGDKYLPHRFALISGLGSILFSLMGVQGAVLSLAGDSGVGKTTISQFALSAFGNPQALEVSPQSTEKAFHETWYIASNLPVLINEAATLDVFKLSSLIYAAANGQARATLTRNSELRESEGWQLLTIFTSNNHMLSLDDKFLNEANRRRILEMTLTKRDHLMDREVALVLNRTMTEHYGVAGRLFVQHVVKHRADITQLLRTIYEHYATGDIPAENRFCLWMIAVAQVAGRIGEKLGIIRFDTEAACKYAAEIVRTQAREVIATEQKVSDTLTEYITDHQGGFTRYDATQKIWVADVRGPVAGRYLKDKDGWTLAIPVTRFTAYARERGVDRQHITEWMKTAGVTSSVVALVHLGGKTRSLIIKIEEGDEG